MCFKYVRLLITIINILTSPSACYRLFQFCVRAGLTVCLKWASEIHRYASTLIAFPARRQHNQMNIPDALNESFRACEGAALALAYVLRPIATKNDPPANVVTTYQEAQAFAITCRAVMDEVAPILQHFAPDAQCVGKFMNQTTTNSTLTQNNGNINDINNNDNSNNNRKSNSNSSSHNNSQLQPTVCNGYDALAMILIKLFAHATQAILDVAANHSRWLITPLQASVCFDRMVTHHGQLRGFYGIMHLAAKISSHTPDTMATLFVDINEKTEPDMQPSKWRTAIKLDDFYGRHFGFHYTPEMRNVLRVVNIARGSVLKSHNEDDTSPQLIKNAVMLGWGWIYSNMVIMDNLGLTIDGVSRIGADVSPDSLTIEQLRKFMNLVEEPLVAGVSGLASADVAIDTSFEIPPPGHEGGLEISNDTATDALHEVLEAINDTVRLRLISQKNRPIDLVKLRSKPTTNNPTAKKQPEANPTKSSTDEGQNNLGGNDIVESVHNNGYNHSTYIVSDINVLDEAVVLSAVDTAQYTTTTPPLSTTTGTGCVLPSATSNTNANSSNGTPSTPSPPSTSASSSVASTTVAQKVEPHVDIDVLNNSFLASTIKSEFRKFQSNVSTFLGLEEKKPASGLILYFHGGGFVSQSSQSHAPYLKEWCCDVPDSVLLSVDYRLAPEFKFPRAMYECLYAYIWALQNASALGTSADRVVFTGDSAGGNLAIATALKASELGIRGADGICVSYPALYLTAAWSPSRLLSFFDPMLPVSVLELCLKSYIPDDVNPKTHPLVSPLTASDEALQRLGPITVVSGSLDPLLDDAAVFAQRLRNLRSDDTFHVFQSMPHGFLNMCHVNETARTGMRFLARMIAQYLELPLRKRSKEEFATTELAVSQVDATESAQKFTTS